MARLLKLFAMVAVTAALGACASGVKYAEMQSKIPAQKSELGRIYFYRPSAVGAAIRPDVMLNGEKVGEAVSWGFFWADRPPGEYTAVTSTEVERKVSFTLEKGQTRYIRLATSMGFFVGHVYGELVDPSVGGSEIQTCRYTGGDK